MTQNERVEAHWRHRLGQSGTQSGT
jgi:hypothetical protein